jgi:NAD(P)-dependent dehydrogenase (short-subunit alcohol dehydrogenase family)
VNRRAAAARSKDVAHDTPRLASFPAPFDAVVFGAAGGLGRAFVEALAADPAVGSVTAVSRRTLACASPKVVPLMADLLDEASIAAAAVACRARAPRLVVVATGILHEPAGLRPEKTLQELDPATLALVMAVNATGPALVVKHFAPLLPRTGKSVIAALSARVGSISDNRLGGWYAYRASKAALNQLLRTASIEVARRWREACVVGLHPGTVATALSEPFRGNVPPGKLFSPALSAGHLLAVIDRLSPADTGRCFAWDGAVVDP